MRRPKVILCVMPDEEKLSLLSFMLKTKGYRVLSASNVEDAVIIISKRKVDLVIATDEIPVDIPFLYATDGSTTDFLERIKIRCKSKRGPKPGSPSAIRCGLHNKAVA